MDLKKFAYIILEKTLIHVEFTLTSSPQVFAFIDNNWKEIRNSIFTSGLSFHCKLISKQDLEKINNFIKEENVMNAFQEYCYCYKPNENNQSQKKTETKQSKMSILRQKINSMNLKDVKMNDIQHKTIVQQK